MPRLSANLGFLWQELPLLERIDAAATAGFEAIELHWPYDVPARHVRDACAAHNLVLLGLNTAVGNAKAGDFGLGAIAGREAEFQSAVDRAIEYCLESGATSIHAMAGVIAQEERHSAHHVFLNNLSIAAEKAGRQNISLLLEPINPRDKPNYFYSRVQEAANVIAELGAQNVKLLFDVYHVAVSEGDVLTKLKQYMPVIGHIQIAAVPSRAEPDEGEIAFDRVIMAVDALEYSGWIGCEYRPRTTTNDGLAWCRRYLPKTT